MARLAVLALTFAAIVLAACGGSSKQSTGERLNAVCKEINAKTDPLGKDVNGHAKHDLPALQKLLGYAKEGDRKVAAIAPGDKDRSAYDAFRAVSRSRVTEIQHLLNAAQTGDDPTYRAQFGVSAANQKAQQPALKRATKKLGAPDCAK